MLGCRSSLLGATVRRTRGGSADFHAVSWLLGMLGAWRCLVGEGFESTRGCSEDVDETLERWENVLIFCCLGS